MFGSNRKEGAVKIIMKPVLKWVGGKSQLLREIRKRIPDEIETYYEPFIGGGAVFFNIAPNKAVISDMNSELINLYQVIKNSPEELIKSLKKHENTPEYFYKIRAKDRDHKNYKRLSPITKASRLVYLNRTCFNGLFRVNSRGELNAPFGRYRNPQICNEPNIREIADFLKSHEIEIIEADFETALSTAKAGDFVYLDPPYDPVTDTASFTGYVAGGFDREQQRRLKACCDELHAKGVKFMLSNSSTEFILELYKDYNVEFVDAKRNINCKGNSRGAVQEVLVRNYE